MVNLIDIPFFEELHFVLLQDINNFMERVRPDNNRSLAIS